MAETTDRPADPASAPASIPAAPAPSAAEAPQTYGSVSILAVVGFAVAVVYAAVIGVGALIAVFNHTPWLLPTWSFLFPAAAAAISWAARVRIRGSEGALTGSRLTTWGAGLGVVVGLIYAAYYAGSYTAVSTQACAFTNQWMDLLKKGQFDQAFLLSLPPPRPADDENLRDRLEMDFDRSPEGRGGPLTNFRQSQLVRQFQQGDSQWQFLGVQSWSYDKGSYQLDLNYRVVTPPMTSDMVVTVASVENPDDGERQWFVKEPRPLHDPVMSEEGVRMSLMDGQARRFGQTWLDKLGAGDEDNAYLETLPVPERLRQRKERGPAFDAGLKAFYAGSVVRADPDTFWAGRRDKDPEKTKARQKEMADKVRAMFARGENPRGLSLTANRPTYRRDAEQARLGYDVTVMTEGLKVDMRLELAVDVRGGDPQPEDWRVEALDLISAKSAGVAPPGPQVPPPGGKP